MTPVQASMKVSEKTVFCNIQDNREKRLTKNNSGELVRTADVERTLSKRYSTNWSHK